MLLYLMTFLIPRILTFSAGAQHLFVVASCCRDASGVQGGRGRGHGLLQPPPTCPGPTYPRPRPQQQPAPPRRATPLGRGRPVPCRGNTAGANLRRLLGLGVCSCAPISGTCGTQHRSLALHRAQDTDRRHGERLLPRSHSQ